MSWQSYVDNNLLGTGKVSEGAIYDLNGGKWAASPGFELQDSELRAIVAAYSDPSSIYVRGIRVNGVTYPTLGNHDKFFYGRKGAGGVCIAKTARTIVVGTYKEPIQHSECLQCVDQLASSLIGIGY